MRRLVVVLAAIALVLVAASATVYAATARKAAKQPAQTVGFESASTCPAASLPVRKKPAGTPTKPARKLSKAATAPKPAASRCTHNATAGRQVRSATELPSFVPDRLGSELGEPASNGGDHGWARLASTLTSTASFTGSGGTVTMQMRGAPASSRGDFENGATYLTSDYAVVQAFHGTSLKESIVVPRRLGVHTWTWKLGTGKLEPRLTPTGAVDLRNGLFIPAPVVTSASGSRLSAPPAWSLGPDRTVSLTVDDRSFPTPYIVDPGVAPTVAFTGFTAASGNTYVDPAYALTRLFINSSQSGTFTVNSQVNDPDDVNPQRVCFPVYGAGWTQDGGCVAGTTGVSLPGILATYYSGSTAGNPAPYPGGAQFTTTNYGMNAGGASCGNQAGTVGPFSRMEANIDSYANWGVPGANDDTPYSELCDELFSAKWTGTFTTPNYNPATVPEAGIGGQPNPYNRFFFGTVSDDGIRVKVNGTVVLANWKDQGPQFTTSCPIDLAPNTKYSIEVEYYENAGNNRAQVYWRTPGSTNAVKAIPPSSATANTVSYCYDAGGGANTTSRWTRLANSGSAYFVPPSTTASAGTSQWSLLAAGGTLQSPLNNFSRTYSWTPGAAAPSPVTQNIVAEDQAAPDPTPGTAPFTVIADGVGPDGGSMGLTAPLAAGGLYPVATSPAVRLNWNANGTTDGAAGAVSGIAGTGEIWRQDVPFDNGNDTCDAFPATWTAGNSTTGIRTGITTTQSNGTDTLIGPALVSGRCYRWALVFKDNVGNVGTEVSQVLRYDLTAPSGLAVTVTPGTNPAWMYVAGTTLFYNNSAGKSGTLTVGVTGGDLESGVASTTFPALPAGWTPNAAQTDNSSPYSQAYSWTSASVTSGAKQASVKDVAGNTGTTGTYSFVPDSAVPVAGSTTYLNGFWGTTTYLLGFDPGNDGAGSGVASWQIERRQTTMQPNGTCNAFVAAWAPIGGLSPAGTTLPDAVVTGNCYMYRITTTDNVGNVQTFTNTNVLRVDDQPPTASFLGTSGATANSYLQPATNVIWYNPAGAGSFNVDVTATDLIGMTGVTFPATGAAGWTGPTPPTDTTATGTTFTSAPYSWSAGATDPAPLVAVATDTAGNTTNVPFEINRDATAPSGGKSEPPSTLTNSTSVPLTLTAATDAESGVKSWSIDVQQAPLSGGACGVYGAFAATGLSGVGAPPASTTYTAAGTGCFRYRMQTIDNVGNVELGATSTNAKRIDVTNPTVSVTGPANGSAQTGTFTISGGGSESATSLTNVSVTYSGPAAGTACASATLTPAGAGAWTWTCAWTTPATDGTYTITVTGTDAAGNTGTTTWTYKVDNSPPNASWTSWSESSAYLYAPASSPDLLYYNPAAPAAGSGTATATVTASDAGAGMDRVVFPSLGAAGWGAGGTDSTVTAPNLWSWGYAFTGGGAIGDPALANATAYDLAGANTGAPALNFRIEPDNAAPTGATFTSSGALQSTPSYTATAVLGTDALSGVASWRLDYRFAELVDGVCGTWEPWTNGASTPGFFGAGANGQTQLFNIRIDDANADGVPDYAESLCFQTQLYVTDNVSNTLTGPLSAPQRFDFGNPSTTLSVPASGSGTVTVTGVATDAVTLPAPAYPVTGSGLQDVTVTYLLPDGPDADALPDASGTICTTTVFAGAWTAGTWSCPWVTNALPDGTYTVTAVATDKVGRTSAPVTRTILLDNFAPVAAWASWNDYGSAVMHSLGNVAWVNPNAPAGAYTLDARLTAYDMGSGMNRVDFPAMGAGWTPAGASTGTFTSPTPVLNAWTRSFTFGTPASLAQPGVLQAKAFDNAGNQTPVGFEVRLDGIAPAGGSTGVVNGRQSTGIVTVPMTMGADNATGSGMGGWQLLYQTAPLANDVCGTWSAGVTSIPGATGTGATPASYSHDVTALGSGCYRYVLREFDNVANVVQYVASGERRVDLGNPTVAITSPASASAASGTFNVTGTAGDAHTGIEHVELTWTGPSGTGTICNPATLGGTPTASTFTCSWNTSALLDGTYTVRAISFDKAGRQSANFDITLLLDNQPPFIGFHSFTESTPYTYWAGPVGTNTQLWYNPSAPNAAYSFDVNVTSFDLGSGVNRVEFQGGGTGWTPGGAVATDTTSSAAPAANSYTATYTFNTGVPGLADPPTLSATSYDPANNPAAVTFELTPDSAAPATGNVSSANGYVASTSVPVTIATGGDGAGSGVASWKLYRSSGTLSSGSCIGWGPYTALAAAGASGAGTFSGTFTDTVTDPGCFRWELRVTDNVGNVGTFTGTEVVKVDLTPPTGSLVVSEFGNPQWQYLVNPTRIFVNTNQSGSFKLDVTANAASGVQDVAFPALAAGFGSAATVSGPGPVYTYAYSWSSGAGSPPAPVNAVVHSNSLGQLSLPFEVVQDAAAPAGATTAYTSGYTTGSSVSVTGTVGSDGTGSGIATWQMQREAGTLAAGACTWSGSWTNVGAANGPLTQTDSPLTQANCYRYRMQVTDNVGNVGNSAAGPALMVDQTPPSSATITLATGTNPSNQYLASGTSIWVNPNLTGSFTATVTAVDPESGTGTATFPALGAGWALGSAGNTATYTWAAGAAAPALPSNAVVANGSGLTTSVPFSVRLDGAAPTGGTLDQQNGFDTDFSVDLSWAGGNDGAGSGLASWHIERRSAPYAVATDTCSPWSGWSTYPLPTGQPSSPYVDLGVTQPTCYQYQLVETDRVNNVKLTTDGDTVKVIDDIFPPAAFSFLPPTNPAIPAITTGAPAPGCGGTPTYASATPLLDWSNSSDAESGLAEYRVFLDGSGTAATNVPAPTSQWTAASMSDGAHTIGVVAYDNQGNSTNAGPSFPYAVRVDGSAPTASLLTPAAGTWTTDTTPTLSWAAGDANCLARVEVYLDSMVTPVATASGTETTWTPGAAIAEGMHSWKVVAIDSVNKRTSSSTGTFGVDTVAPAAFSLTSPANGSTVRGFVNVAWTASSDTGSGLSGSSAYQVWVDGAVATTVGSGFTTATISGIANGAHTVLVKAVDLVGNTTSTGSATFTGYGVIPAPTLVTPVNGAKMNAVPTLTWTWPSDGGPAPTTYDVLVDGSMVSSTAHPTMTKAIADPGDGNHTWQIVQHDPYTGTVSSTTWSFLIDRTPPTNAGPLSRVGTVVSWPAASDPAAPVASGVSQVQFWINDGSGPVLAATLGAGATSYDYGTLPDGVYTMWVRATDVAGNSTSSSTISVTNDSTPPTAFALNAPAAGPALPPITTGGTAPACETAPTYATATPTLTWQASTDAVSGLAGYDVTVDGIVVGSTAAGVQTWTVAPALSGGTHTWQVTARDVFGNVRLSTPAPYTVRVDGAAPTASLLTPTGGTWTTDTTPTLSFTAGDDSCIARVEVYLDNMVTAVATASGTETTWTPGAAIAEGTHSWKVVAIDSMNKRTSSSTGTFGVDTVAPAAFSLTSPASGSTVRGFVNVAWTASSDAGSGLSGSSAYQVWVDGAVATTVGSGFTTATISGISNGAHTVLVKAVDLVGNTTSTTTANFTGYGVIPAPTLITPVSGAKMNAVPTLTWTWPSDGGPAPTTYDVLVDGSIVSSTAHPTTTKAIADPGDGNHTWQIVQHDPYTGTVSSTTWTFLIDRTPPTNAGPLSRVGTVVSWPAATDPSAPVASGVSQMEFWINDGSGPVLKATLGAGATSYDYGTLPDGVYTMWVRAIDAAGNSTSSSTISVTNDSTPPTAFALNAPAAGPALPAITAGGAAPGCETAPTYATATPTLTWQASTDAVSGLAGYDVAIDGIAVGSTAPGVQTWTVSPALSGGAHTWQVTARDVFGNVRLSTPAPYNVRIDGANPTASLGTPAGGAFTSDTTPTLTFTANDDNCIARVQVTVDGSTVETMPGSAGSWTPAAPLTQGAHTWTITAIDSMGKTTMGVTRTFTVDTTPPTGVTAISPADTGTPNEDPAFAFSWTAGTDAGAGVDHYDLILDGTTIAPNLATPSSGGYPVLAGPHTWTVRAYDGVGNAANFTFSFTAQPVPDFTPPSPFNLLTPADTASIPAGTPLTWQPATDFHGIAGYRVLIDGSLAGTTAGNVTTFTPAAGAGSPICSVGYDPATSGGCLNGPTFSNGAVADSTTPLPTPASTSWDAQAQAGYSASGNAFGVGDPSASPIAGWDGDRTWTAMEYTATVPAGGADLRFEHRYNTHMINDSAYDGGTVEIMVDQAGDGFGNDAWQSTCAYGTREAYGSSLDCDQEIMEVDGGYTAVLAGPAGNNSLAYHNVFAGDPGSIQQSKLRLASFTGKDIKIRFRLGGDSCYVGQPVERDEYCPPDMQRSVWRIDNLTLANTSLLPGVHSWIVQALDPAGNVRATTPWTFNLL